MTRLAWTVPLLLLLAGCQGLRVGKEALPADGLPDLTPAVIDYADTDGFDGQLEAELLQKAPAIIVRTDNTKPDWEGRLDAWIAAWNQGGRSRSRTIRGQLGKVPLDGDSIRELRSLVTELLDRVEAKAQAGAAWYANQRVRSHRVALLKPYSLRFHRDADGPIQLVFFHGSYASYYPRFMKSLMRSPEMAEPDWARTVECSQCLKAGRPGTASLVRVP
jgi:hypothetical protein